MMKSPNRWAGTFIAAVIALAMLGSTSWAQRSLEGPRSSSNLSLVIVIEGLRPDFFTRSQMPNLYALSKRGVTFNSHHAMFPTVAAVNAASIATGAYPSTHGVLGDTIHLPEIDDYFVLDTREIASLEKIQDIIDGKLLTTASLGEILGAHDKRLLVVSSGEAGTALLLSPKRQGGAIIHPDFTQPTSLSTDVVNVLAPAPEDTSTPGTRDAWAVDAYLEVGLVQVKPDVAILWLGEFAETQLESGLGSPRSMEALRRVDEQIGRILQRHKKLRLKTNVFVTSDRGFTSHMEGRDLRQFLIEEGLKASEVSSDVVVFENGSIFVAGHNRSRIRKIVQRLERLEWVGAIFTQQSRPTHPESFVPGALSFQAVYMDHPRAPDILVEPAWSDDRNAYGYGGTTRGFGEAGGGTSSPYAIETILVAAGPDIKRGIKSVVPTAHIDLAPTLCSLLGIEPPATMDGRILREALRGGPKPDSIEVLRRRHGSQATWEGGRYRLFMTELAVDGVDYLDFTKLDRK